MLLGYFGESAIFWRNLFIFYTTEQC